MTTLWEDLVPGTVTGTIEFEVTEQMIDEYLDAMEFSHPWFTTGAAPYGSRIVPTDMVAKLAMTEVFQNYIHRELGPNMRARQAFKFYAPVHAGTKVKATGRLTEKYERCGKRFVTLEVVTEFGQDGSIRVEMAARRATEDVSDQTIALESVSVGYFALPGQRWNFTADAGSARPGLNTVELSGNVVMTGGKQTLPEPAVVRTERLTLDVRSQQALTDAPVTLGLGPYSLASTDMRADLKSETLRLESGVNVFQP